MMRVLFLCVALFAATALAQEEEEEKVVKEIENEDLKTKVEKAHLEFLKMMCEGKMKEAVEKFYWEDAKYLCGDGKVVKGWEMLIDYFTKTFNHTMGEMPEDLKTHDEIYKAMDATWTSLDLMIAEEMAVDHSMIKAKLPMADHKFPMRTLSIWKLKEGVWKIYLDSTFADWMM